MAKQTQVQKAASELSNKRWARIGKKARSEFMKQIRAGGAGQAQASQELATDLLRSLRQEHGNE